MIGTKYAKLNNDVVEKYPLTIEDIFKENSNVSFPVNITDEVLKPFGYVIVNPIPKPIVIENTKKAVEDVPINIDGKWQQNYVIIECTPEENIEKTDEKIAEIKMQRLQKLRDSDWTQGKDIADEISQPWAEYRQILRDIPTQSGFPWHVIWPNSPQ
jgi:hypothetical protein